MKMYVVEKTITNSDGDELQIVNVYESKPHGISYLVWVNP